MPSRLKRSRSREGCLVVLKYRDVEVMAKDVISAKDVEISVGEVNLTKEEVIRARRTAFVARFIVLREGKRTRAHRLIESMEWDDLTTVEELAQRFRQAFLDNGDSMMPVDRDLRRSLAHSYRSLKFFVKEYSRRATGDFVTALEDYGFSNQLLFADEEQPRSGGWRLPRDIRRGKVESGVKAQQGLSGRGKISQMEKLS